METFKNIDGSALSKEPISTPEMADSLEVREIIAAAHLKRRDILEDFVRQSGK